MAQEQVTQWADAIAQAVADKCHGDRKPEQARERYAIIWQAARLGAIEAQACLASTATHTEAVDRLVEALEFYADAQGDGYEAYPANYGLSMDLGEVVQDQGKRAREALAAYREAKS